MTYFQYPGEYPISDYLFIYFISAHQHQYRAKVGGILMLVSDTDTDTDSNSALGDRLFWKFSTWPHLTHFFSCCSGISSVLND